MNTSILKTFFKDIHGDENNVLSDFLARGQPVRSTSCDLVFVHGDEYGCRWLSLWPYLLDFAVCNDAGHKMLKMVQRI